MKKITLAKSWTYRTPLVTVEYPAGEHEVTDAIAAAYEAEGKKHGGRTAKAGSASVAAAAEG